MKPKRHLWEMLPFSWNTDDASEAMPWVVVYLFLAFLLFAFYSQLLGIVLFANAALALVIGMIARGLGKPDAPAVLLGLLLGPLGALAGMLAARPR